MHRPLAAPEPCEVQRDGGVVPYNYMANPSCDLLDIHELLRSHEGLQASAPTEEEAQGRENYNDILSM